MIASNTPVPLTASSCGALRGTVRVAGDKSISHRALIFGALAVGTSEITGLLEGEDVLHTAEAMRAFGVQAERLDVGHWRVQGVGVGGFLPPKSPLYFGNSGTGCRLVMGLAAGCDFPVTFDGDASLRKRPMKRVLEPLMRMEAQVIDQAEGGRLPLTLQGAQDVIPIVYETAVPSAQVKSAVLLAGLNCAGTSCVIEREATRDHTERMLVHFGADVKIETQGMGRRITLKGQPELAPSKVLVPADPSSAAFPLVGALLVGGSQITLTGVMTNPLRTGLFLTLQEMGASIRYEDVRLEGSEEIANIVVKASSLRGVDVPAERAPSMIDEYPILAVAAAFATGETRMRGLSELRVKESDRLASIIDGLRGNGVDCAVEGDDLIVYGTGSVSGGGVVTTHMDHRIAMAFLVMGLASDKPITVDDGRFIATSFPDFTALMRGLGADIS